MLFLQQSVCPCLCLFRCHWKHQTPNHWVFTLPWRGNALRQGWRGERAIGNQREPSLTFPCLLCHLLKSPYNLVPGLLLQLYATSDFAASGLLLEGSFSHCPPLIQIQQQQSLGVMLENTWNNSTWNSESSVISSHPPPKTQIPVSSSTHLLAKLVALEEGNLGLRSTLISLDANHSHQAWHRESALCQTDTSHSHLGRGDFN